MSKKRKSITIHFDNVEMKEAFYSIINQNSKVLPKAMQDACKDLYKMETDPEMVISPKTDTIKFSKITRDKGRVVALNDEGVPEFTRYVEIKNDAQYVVSEEGKLVMYFKKSGKPDRRAGQFHNFNFLFLQDWKQIEDPEIKEEKLKKEREEKTAKQKAEEAAKSKMEVVKNGTKEKEAINK